MPHLRSVGRTGHEAARGRLRREIYVSKRPASLGLTECIGGPSVPTSKRLALRADADESPDLRLPSTNRHPDTCTDVVDFGILLATIPDSSMVEHPAVNRVVP